MGSVFFEGLSPGDWIQKQCRESKGAVCTSNRDPPTLNIFTEDLKRKRKKDFSFQKLTLMWPTIAFISVPFSLVRSRHHLSPRLLFFSCIHNKIIHGYNTITINLLHYLSAAYELWNLPPFFPQCHLYSVSSLRPANFLVIND